MKQTQQPEKRIVSMREHTQLLAERAVANVIGTGLCMISCVFCYAILYSIYLNPYRHGHYGSHTAHQIQNFWVLLCVAPFAFYFITKLGHDSLRHAANIDPGVPLPRANAADLPAPDSLVRASQEPAQAQEGILLRAAVGEAQAEQEGQLLRASVGKEQEV